MDLYFLPLACSVAPRIVADEQGIALTMIEVDKASRKTERGEDFEEISPLGQVPALRLEDGEVLLENVAILDHLGSLGDSELAPQDADDRRQILRWLCFINSELHAIVFHYLLTDTSKEAQQAARGQADARFAVLERKLTDREFLLDRFTAADAYLFIVLTWAASRLTLEPWPNLARYRERLAARPSVGRAMAIELPLYRARNGAKS